MRSTILAIALIVLIIFGSSCRKDFEYTPSSGNLSFSKDTVYLDTIFTNISSSTYTLKVYNKTKNDITIPTIALANGNSSGYRLNVDGAAGTSFNNIPLFAKDSLYIFIEVTQNIPEGKNNWLYTDAIVFNSDSDQQEVPLVTLIKDAFFLYPETQENGTKEQVYYGLDELGSEIMVNGLTLNEEQLHFTNEKAYVIYGYASVPENKELVIDAGARIHFHKNSGIVVQDKASIKINGVLSTDNKLQEGEVIFEGDRLEPELAKIPGQWGSLRLNKGSVNNKINYLTIKNATTGLYVEGNSDNKLQLDNSKIYNSSDSNFFGKTAKVASTNLVVGGAGDNGIYLTSGGEYSFTHATIANYWTHSFREGYSLKINNEENLINTEFNNCIINGNKANEIFFEVKDENVFQLFFTNCLINISITDNTSPLFNLDNTQYYNSSYANEDAYFVDVNNYNFNLTNASFAINKGSLEKASLAPLDLNKTNRLDSPDIGAFEYQE